MSVSAEAVANTFLALARESGRSLTNMQLQKLVYIAHGYHLALRDAPLIHDHIHAWQFGPVYPKLYRKLSKYGAGEVTEDVPSKDQIDRAGPEMGIISGVWTAYGQMSGGKLSTLTHRQNSPWSEAYAMGQNTIIPDAAISAHYKMLVEGGGNGGH